MASKTALLIAVVALSGCAYHPGPEPAAGTEPVNVPVVSRSDFVFDAAAPNGTLSPSEGARLDGWFQGLDLRYGDVIYVDGSYSEAARAQVSEIASKYGIMVSSGSPVTAGPVAPGSVRIIVSRTVAGVPNCPRWDTPASPNYNNKTMPNFGCAVNGNLAAMVANPEDLVHGREGTGVGDAATATRAITYYRTAPPSASKGLEDTSTKSGGSK
jgi:pilus assembly protein CpaD